jgi:CRP-like cAMP-binding protein
LAFAIGEPLVLKLQGLRSEAMPHRNNFLLNRLEPDLLAQIEPHLSLVELPQGKVLARRDDLVERVYFPHSGIISCVVELKGGEAIATAMIGSDGAFGAGQALDDHVSLNDVIMQVAGTASVIRSERICDIAEQLPAFRRLLVSYEQFLTAQVQQTGACNAIHSAQARTCKWLLRMHQLAGDDLLLTQEFLAQMMGVRRTTLTGVAGQLQKAGMITYHRGRIHILDLEMTKRTACECDEDIRSRYRKIFALNGEGAPFNAPLPARRPTAR